MVTAAKSGSCPIGRVNLLYITMMPQLANLIDIILPPFPVIAVSISVRTFERPNVETLLDPRSPRGCPR
jgi:hypothetical protein